MSVTKAKELGNLKISQYPHTIGYANGHAEPTVGILKNFPINIGGFDLYLNIIIADTRDRYDFPPISGRKFFVQVTFF